jgi:hypothetical protein
MNNENAILIRRQLLDWRDKHIENIHNHLSSKIAVLLRDLNNKINNMSLTDIYSNEDYTKKYLEPICSRWIKHETAILINAAQSDLNSIYQRAIEYKENNNNLNPKNDSHNIQKDAITALISTGAGVAAIPTAVSTATVSVGGIMGLLGVTTISLPIAIVGGAIVGSLLAFGGSKIINIKSDAIERYKNDIRKAVQERVIYNKYNNSVCQCLQAQITEVTRNLIKEFNI